MVICDSGYRAIYIVDIACIDNQVELVKVILLEPTLQLNALLPEVDVPILWNAILEKS
jgi:hypothetical protein